MSKIKIFLVNNWFFCLKTIIRLVSVIIMGQTLYFKFSGAEESIFIFTKVGMEPWGRYGTGLIEMIACILILIPSYSWLGSFLSVVVMFGAIFSHLTLLNIVVQNDGGLLFTLACIVFSTSLLNLFFERAKIPIVGELLTSAHFKKATQAFKGENIGLGALFLGICISIALIGIAQQIYTIDRVVSLNSQGNEQVRHVAQIAYFLTIIGVLLAFFLALVLLRVVGQPITKLTEVCKMIVSGNHTARAITSSVSEIQIMSNSFNHMLDELNKKEANNRSLLNGISNAVFFFLPDGTISKEKSLATTVIFKKINNFTNIKDFFLNYTQSSHEEIQNLISLFWDRSHELSFESIAELLPKNLVILDGDENQNKKYIHLTYHSELDQKNQLSRIIVVGTDKTEEILASIDSKLKEERVKQISLVSQNKSDYLSTFEDLNKLFEESLNLNCDLVVFKRHLHTIKGVLASFEFKTLAEEVHHLEDLLKAENQLNQSEAIKSKLKDLFEKIKQEDQSIKNIFGLNSNNDLTINIQLNKFNELKKKIFQTQDAELKNLVISCQKVSAYELFDKYKKYLVSLNEKNDSKMIKLTINPQSTEIRPEIVTQLHGVLGHILRNSFDHGIETIDQRDQLGKDIQGEIQILAQEFERGNFILKIKDDGKGLDLERLASKAVQNGIWDQAKIQSATDLEKINLIFLSGLSTQEAVSETSGRGVGMDAVKAQIESLGGQIEIKTEKGKGTEFTIKLSSTFDSL